MMTNLHNISILLVEDNLINQKVALRILDKFGYTTDSVENGKEAIAVLGKTKFDLILMDVQMPEMDGIEATKIIRDTQSNVIDHNVPIVALTAHAMKGDRERCLDAGMNDYVAKPINPNTLKEAIDKQLNYKQASGFEEYKKVNTLNDEIFAQMDPLDRFEGDIEFASEIVDVFLENFNSQIEQLEHALQKKDAVTVERIAHSIKGACLNVCAVKLSDVAFEIEKTCKNKELTEIDQLVVKLEEDFTKFKSALHDSGLIEKH